MFGFGLKKPTPTTSERHRLVGIDLSASRMRGVAAGSGSVRALHLDDPHEDLPLTVSLDRRPAQIGHAADARTRLLPHNVCSNFLPLLATPNEWRGERLTLSPEAALAECLKSVRPAIEAESDAVGLALPGYLNIRQVRTVLELATTARWPVRGSAAASLAIVSHRAAGLSPSARGIDPTVLLIDADDHAVSAAVIAIGTDEVKLLASSCIPRTGVKAWKDRLIDGLADRCVRVCRRDPRDSAAAEQDLYLHLDDALDAARVGRRVTLGVRAEKWYQDLTVSPDEFEQICEPVNRVAIDGLKQFLFTLPLAVPPRAVWLTFTAGRLPGLAAKIYKHSPEQTQVSLLPANAAAEAAAALVPRWLTGQLPRAHLEASIPHARRLDVREGGAKALPAS
ncbi:MAG: hypothetical protein MUF18_03845 [Fimbriiglobus sp.]|jgi:hypothetical protein|nr:hypothetical protein [Fimbriiglobus sp.]